VLITQAAIAHYMRLCVYPWGDGPLFLGAKGGG
jgi:hypothetical protein